MNSISLALIAETVGSGYHFEEIGCHRGVILLIGERSQPERAIEWLDTLNNYELSQLVAIRDWKGGLHLFWKKIPERFANVSDVEVPDGDVWSIYGNVIVP